MIDQIAAKPLKYLVFDLETAGLDFARHQIFEIGLVACEGNEIKDRLGLKLQYLEGPVQIGALKTTKIDIVTWNEQAGVLSVQQFCSKILDFLHRNFGDIGPYNRIVLGGHNCFYRDTSIWMADGTWKAIWRIQAGEEVKTVDGKGRIVHRKVVRQIINRKDKRKWVEVKVDGARNYGVGRWGNPGIKCTGEHIWIGPKKFRKRADKLIRDDEVLLPRQGSESLVLGALLGDGHSGGAKDGKGHNRIAFCHTNQKWSERKASHLGTTAKKKHVKTTYGETDIWAVSATIPKKWRDKVYDENRTKKWCNEIDNKALAVLYCDDGCLDSHDCATLACHCFRPRLDEIMSWATEKFGKCSWHNEAVLYFWKATSNKLFSKIARYIPPEMYYKLPKKFQGRYNGWLEKDEPQTGYVEEVVKHPRINVKYTNYKYCLEIEDTHCFFTRGGLVKNCNNFDKPFLQHFVDKIMPNFGVSFGHKFSDIFSTNTLDTMNIAQFLRLAGKFEYNEFGLKALLEVYGVPFNEESLHGALADAVLTAKLLFAMLPCTKAEGNGDYGMRLNKMIAVTNGYVCGGGALLKPTNMAILKSVGERIQKGYKLTASQKQEFENLWREVMV